MTDAPKRRWSRVLGHAREMRVSALPKHKESTSGYFALAVIVAGARRLVRKMRDDRVPDRAAALAFFSALSVVPAVAVTLSIVQAIVGDAEPRETVEYFLHRFFPRATNEAVDQLVPIVTSLRFDSAGVLGVLALLPLAFTLVSRVERALAQILRTPKRPAPIRFALYAGLVLSAPVVTLIAVRYGPDVRESSIFYELWPPAISTFVLFLAFRFLPGVHVPNRMALLGAVTSSVLLTLSRNLFELYAAHATRSLHLVWGAISFFPLFMIWIFASWIIVLFGAEVAAVGHDVQSVLRANRRSNLRKARARYMPRERRLRERLIQRPDSTFR